MPSPPPSSAWTIVRSLPTVESATLVRYVPLDFQMQDGDVVVEGAAPIVLDISDMTGGLVDGVLGLEVFRDVLLTLDVPGQRARVARGALEAGAPEQVFDGKELALLRYAAKLTTEVGEMVETVRGVGYRLAEAGVTEAV